MQAETQLQNLRKNSLPRVGIDENGLGPLLGPLLVTAVTAVGPKDEVVPTAALVDDSKRLVGFGHSALGEAWARVILRGHGQEPAGPAALIDSLLGDSGRSSRALCPDGHAPQCWRDEAPWDASPELLEQVQQSADTLREQGWTLARVRAEHVCTRELNDEEAAGRSRLHVNLGRMERLIVDAQAHVGLPVHASCGKVGGMRYYVPQLRLLAVRSAHEELASGSSYTLTDDSFVEFLRDAESQRPLVALASLVGKYVRDRIMQRICNFHGAGSVSGYHDPRTLRAVEATRAARSAANFDDSCFVRFGKKKSAGT